MTLLSRTEVASELGICGIGEHNTVSSGPDTGGNNNIACGFWNSMRHATSEVAITNFESRLNKKTSEGDKALLGAGGLNLCGHGSAGFLTTGCGQHGEQDYLTNYITAWNVDFSWGRIFSRLQTENFPFLKIWSCQSGAGSAGADLLFEMAKIIKKPVLGNTGLLYSNSDCKIWQENGAVWQTATPTHRPDPIQPPSTHLFPKDNMQDYISIGGTDISIDEITDIKFEFRSHTIKAHSCQLKEKTQILILARELASSQKFELPGNPMAFISAQIIITWGKDNKKLIINVFNDTLCTDDEQTIGFYVGPMLNSMIATFKGLR